MARQIYAELLYPSNTDFICMILNNHIKNWNLMVRYIDVAQEIWGRDKKIQ